MGIKAASWKSHLDGWRVSGLSQAAYCSRHGLSLSSFGYWRRTLAPKSEDAVAPLASMPALVPIVVGDAPLTDGRIEVLLPNGLQVVLPSGLDPARLVPTIRALWSC